MPDQMLEKRRNHSVLVGKLPHIRTILPPRRGASAQLAMAGRIGEASCGDKMSGCIDYRCFLPHQGGSHVG